ncbi:hypothetical protein CK203_016319 [Vitis vinifera]|uniref:Uncharacterized protein n=1 Tax=Vitis vinifera TaxID=29760 RepID=A0A438JMJ6_VITVI|nr:hypothetical protein CK203_016319 [Vitis vinifera]
MASAHAAITTPKVPNQNSNEQQKFCFTLEEFHKLMALANSVQPNSSNQNNVQPDVNLVTTSHFSDHMICSPLLYHSTPKPINASINLPNGTTVPATHIGTDQSMEKMIGIALEKEGLYHLILASS